MEGALELRGGGGGCLGSQELEDPLWMRWRPLQMPCGEIASVLSCKPGNPTPDPFQGSGCPLPLSSSIGRILWPRQPPLVLSFKSVTYFSCGEISTKHLIVYLRFTLWLFQCWLSQSSRDWLDHCASLLECLTSLGCT